MNRRCIVMGYAHYRYPPAGGSSLFRSEVCDVQLHASRDRAQVRETERVKLCAEMGLSEKKLHQLQVKLRDGAWRC